jgi:divalent metal cation (Fe/Co/Zn/Cd) transporter
MEPLMRPQNVVEADVRELLTRAPFNTSVVALSHFTCHYLNGKLTVQLEVVFAGDLRISEARGIAKQLGDAIRQHVAGVHHADVHLELTCQDIDRVLPPLTIPKHENSSLQAK